ncbi:sulfur-containing aminoacid acetyltransferase SnaB [Deferribacterales bacterium RsTz2092]|nr:putative N-acetyltransferase YxeL [Deferribacterales bacterium]
MASIRAVSQADSAPYRELLHLAYEDSERLGIHFAAYNATQELIEEHIASNLVYLLEEDSRFVSTISLRLPWGNNPGPFGLPHLGWFATHPHYCNKGHGRKLFEWLERNILKKQLKLPALTVGTALEHPWLPQLYMRYGFKEIGRTKLTSDHTTVYFEKIVDENLYIKWAKAHK